MLASSAPNLIPERTGRQDAKWDLISDCVQVSIACDQRVDESGTCTGQNPTVVGISNRDDVGRFRSRYNFVHTEHFLDLRHPGGGQAKARVKDSTEFVKNYFAHHQLVLRQHETK